MTTSQKVLPAGYTIVAHPRTKVRFVRTPAGKLVPNQGTLKAGLPQALTNTDEAIIADFYIWFNKQAPSAR